MTIKRIVLDIATSSVPEVRQFYEDLFGLQTVMDQGWITTLATGDTGPIQISIAKQGGSGTPVPDASIEVDNVDEVYAHAQRLGYAIPYPIIDEPWGVRRFFVVDPAGKVLNILMHSAQ